MKFDEWGYRKNKKWSRRRTPTPLPTPPDDTESEVEQTSDLMSSPTSPRSAQGQGSDSEPGFEITGYRSAPSKDAENPQRHMSLHDAVIQRRLDRVFKLLSEGISPAARHSSGNTPLHYASKIAEENYDDLLVFTLQKRC
jgi:ankyrin repeat protein